MKAHAISQGERRFALYQYLIKNTSYDQVVSKKELKEHLKNNYDVDITDPTFYEDIKALQGEVYGLEIIFDPTKNKGAGGYYVDNPPFEAQDIRLLIDCIQSAKFITQKKADELSSKVKSLSSSRQSSSLERPSFVMNRVRTMEDSSMNLADTIYEAIAANAQVEFRYYHRTPNKQNPKKYTKDGDKTCVSPFALVWENGNYYLYAYLSDSSSFRTFRVDRMDKIRICYERDREGIKEYREKDVVHKAVKVFNMFRNPKKEYDVSFICHNTITDAVIDEFGSDIMLIPKDENHFSFKANIELSPPFFAWVSTFGKKIQITSPSAAISEFKKFLRNSIEMYKDEGEK